MTISPENKRILVVDPDARMRDRVEAVLLGAGYEVSAPPVAAGTLERPGRQPFDAVIMSIEWAGPEPSKGIRKLGRRVRAPLLVLCGPDQTRAAVKLLQHGAEDYLLRPPDPFEVQQRLERILEHHEMDSRISFFQNEISKKAGPRDLEVRSPTMRSMLDRLMRVAPMRSTVLICGESGVGKELVARAIHFNSPRLGRPFVALNCAAIPANLIESELFGHERGAFTGAHARVRGKFEIAHRGTLFLDEIGEMTAATQVKLLRVLEEREFMRVGGDQTIRVDARVITATNADLENLVSTGLFRRDLYYRLKVVTIRVPPLRERREDTPYLIHGFLEELARTNAMEAKSITGEALAALTAHSWPGNVRELKNLLESLLVSVKGNVIRLEDLPPTVHGNRPGARTVDLEPGMTLEEMERLLIRHTLEHTGGNRTHTAELLGIGVRTLQRKIRGFRLEIRPTRRRRRGAAS